MRVQRIAGILLAGGRSKRMGTDKALLPLPGSIQISFLQHLTQIMIHACDEVLLVARDKQQADSYACSIPPSVRIITDDVCDTGPLMGLYCGLRAATASHAFVCAVDTPLLQPALLAFLLAQCRTASNDSTGLPDAPIIPIIDGVPQVLLAIYPRALLPQIAERLQAGRRDPRSLLNVVAPRYILEEQLRCSDPDLRSFLNVNTPEELNTLRSLLEMR
jgi:molybdopterin-guanine dinucleotide biosynthesis protein A